MNEAQALAENIINRSKLARIAVLQLQRDAGVGNTTIHRWKNSKTGIYCRDTAFKLQNALCEAERKNKEWEERMAGS